MQTFEKKQALIAFLRASLECSIYVCPTDPGLTYDELLEIARGAGYLPGEISDALYEATGTYGVSPGTRFMPRPEDTVMWLMFAIKEEPDFRNVAAFDFVFEEMHQTSREHGAQHARLERSVLVERATKLSLPRHDVHVAITMMVLNGILLEENNVLRYKSGREGYASPQTQFASQRSLSPPRPNEAKKNASPLVKDVVARRSDGRPKSAEPFEAFAEALEPLGYGPFRLWWAQMVAELRQASAQTSPVTATVLSAALVEAALTFVVTHARALGLGAMGSKTFEGPPNRWRLEDLVSSAASGNEAAILDKTTQNRISSLVNTRQRIHAGRMLSEYPGGPPDLKPEQARDAQLAAEQAVRCVVDWLHRYPA